jgi:hypothetical protein
MVCYFNVGKNMVFRHDLFIVLLEITAKVQHESNVFTKVSAMVTSKMHSTLLRLVTCLRKNIGIQCE